MYDNKHDQKEKRDIIPTANKNDAGLYTQGADTAKTAGSRKKIYIIAAAVLAVILIVLCVWFFFFKDKGVKNSDPVYVNSVAVIAGLESQTSQKYSGIVNPEKNIEIKKDESKTVTEIYVTEGQEINEGDKLFSYDINEMTLSLQQAKLDLEGCNSSISTLKSQISDLEKERKSAGSDSKITYTLKIQEAELEIKKQEYTISTKQAEIAEIEKSIANADVYAEKSGTIKSINTGNETDNYGNPMPFISIQTNSEYKIRGTVSELNINYIYEGQAVKVYSRVDPNATWNGFVESVDRENTAQDNNNSVMYYGAETETTSKYYFYVTLDNLDGLILGQHVYIEPDYGQDETREGIWLPSFYISDIESGSYVWAKSDKDTLEKRSVTLGEYDEENDMYEITEGLSEDDYIAYPDESYKSGMPTQESEDLGAMPMGGADSIIDMPAEGDDDTMYDEGDLGDDYIDENMDGDNLDGDNIEGEDGNAEGSVDDTVAPDGIALPDGGAEVDNDNA